MLPRVSAIIGLVPLLSGCTTSLGGSLVLSASPPKAFKMIRPAISTSSCHLGSPWGSTGAGIALGESIDSILAQDGEIDTLINVSITETRVGVWPAVWSCVRVTGDAGRSAPTVDIPMPGHHHH
jgi:hypothetical protein